MNHTLSGPFFITGTDTEIGKTYICHQLLKAHRAIGASTLGIKPIASGAIDGRNDDAIALLEQTTLPVRYDDINPYCFAPPIAPHIAARIENNDIDIEGLSSHLSKLISLSADLTLIEGAGGWLVPLNQQGCLWPDLIAKLSIPVILVVGMKLGCINHALLTTQAIEHKGLKLHGWIANQITPDMPHYQDNIETLQQLIEAPMLAEVTHQQSMTILTQMR